MVLSKIIRFFKKDVVLSISLLLAAASCFVVPPNAGYVDYIDFHTLILLFCLMLIVEGLREQGFFQYAGNLVLKKVGTEQGVVFTLVFLCFISSMFITNDVALITFVPFGLMVLEMTGLTSKVGYTVVLMTIAANLGSMFTPIGNPQNLYLFSLSGMGIGEFLALMFPYTAASAVLLTGCILLGCRRGRLSVAVEPPEKLRTKPVAFYTVLFLLCILAVAGIVPHLALFVVVTVAMLAADRALFTRVDYSLLLTFTFFFIFIGNMNHVESLRTLIAGLLSGHEKAVSIISSQVISNVPAAMLLSGYTDNVRQLIVGTNLGGLGTLIASMASLISYKQIAGRYAQLKKQYIGTFTVFNVAFLAVLWLISCAL